MFERSSLPLTCNINIRYIYIYIYNSFFDSCQKIEEKRIRTVLFAIYITMYYMNEREGMTSQIYYCINDT